MLAFRLPEPSLRRRFFRLTALNVLANVTVPLVGLVDAGMLGHLEDLRFLGGVALASVLFDYLFWSLNFLRLSTTGITAQARGRRDGAGEFLILYRSLFLAGVLGLAILLFHPWIRGAGFALLGVAPELVGPAAAYFDARIWGAPAVLANFAFLGWFLGREESGRALAMTITANLANFALNAWLILYLNLAALGAGLASAMSQILMLGLAVALFLRIAGRQPWRWGEILRREHLVSLFRLNRDLLLRTLCLTSALAGFTALSSLLGMTALVANTLLLRLMILVAYFIDGAAFALESLAGVLSGAGDSSGLRRMLGLALLTASGVTALCLFTLLAAPDLILSLLTSHQNVVEAATGLAWWLVPVLTAGTAAFVLDGLFLGLTEGQRLRNAMLVSTLGVFAPLATVAAVNGSNHWLWAALSAWMAARAITLALASPPLLGPLRAAP